MADLHFFEGVWREGNPPVMGANDHGFWLGSVVFDGARSFDGVAPDLDLHCARVVQSAKAMGLTPMLTTQEITDLALEGIKRFARDVALYIRPAFWATGGFVVPDTHTTKFVLSLCEMPMPEPKGAAITLSSFYRPSPKQAPTDTKAACLYPLSARALAEARQKGFDNAVLLDAVGNVAELSTANLWMVKDNQVFTPIPNGTFLNGITKKRLQSLLAEDYTVRETTLTYQDFLQADEIFASGNYGKVMPVTRIESRDLQPGPVYRQAREMYWDWSKSSPYA